jgi:hypothetical protein
MVNARAVISAGIVLLLAAAVLFVLIVPNGGAREPRASDPSPTESPVSDGQEDGDRGDPTPLAVPTPDTTGRDFDRIFREISAFRDWLFAHPDPELLHLIYHPDCDCYEETREVLEYLVEEDLRFVGETREIVSISVLDDAKEAATLNVATRSRPIEVLDSEGRTRERTDGGENVLTQFHLVLRDGAWLVRTATDAGDFEGEAP